MLALMVALAMAVPAAELDWIAGHWRSEAIGKNGAARVVEEFWTDGAGGALLGVSRTVGEGRLRGFEFMRIADDGDGTAFFGAPEGAPPVRFPLVAAGAGRAEFVNPDHDFPQRISYRREGDTLTATISKADGTRAISWTFLRR